MLQHLCIPFLFIFCFNLSLCFEEAWQAYQNELRNANREELTVTSVATDENFKLNATVKKWTSISVGPTSYSVGIMDTGLVVLFTTLNPNNTNLDIKSNITELSKRPLDVIILDHNDFGPIEIMLVVIFENELELKWYKIIETELELVWTWNLAQPVVHVNAFSRGENNIILLATNATQNLSRVDLYQYKLKEDYWILHSLPVSNPVTSSAFSTFEFDFYLSLPQKFLGLIGVYKLEDNHFVHFKSIRSKDVENVVSFEIGFESFLAIDGYMAGIYRFRKDELKREHIANSNLNGIVYWLPIPVNTYRDDVILFAQRNLSYASHLGYVIDIFTYDGVKFEEHADIPCNHFGEKTRWLTCLSEGNGIVGSSFVAAEEKLGLIVPRSSNISFLFSINFTINQISNPLEEELKSLVIEKKKILRMIEEYETIRNTSQTSKIVDETPDQILLSRQAKIENISTVNHELESITKDIEDMKDRVNKIVEKENQTVFDTVTINGAVEVQGDGKFKEFEIEQLRGESVSELFDDIVRRDSSREIPAEKIVNSLKVGSIIFDKINGIEANELMFQNDSPIELNGDIIVHDGAEIQSVKLLSKHINNMDLINEIVDMTKEYNGSLNFQMVKVKNEFEAEIINGNDEEKPSDLNSFNSLSSLDMTEDMDASIVLENLTITSINGEDFDIFVRQLCLTNIKCYIPSDVKINGDVVAEKGTVSYLNDVKFPEEYIFKNHDHVPIAITGRKIFTNSLTAKEIISHGKIDGVDTKKLITFSTQQKIPGKITFRDVEVAEELNVTGKIAGEHIDQFLPNPTLQHARNITTNVNFRNLEVDGIIIIEDNLNENNLEATLQDIIYKDEDEAHVLVQKEFPKGFTVKQNLKLNSNSINNVNFDTFVTKNTDQVLNITMLKGNVIIDHIAIKGKFDKENVTQLDQDLVKLSGEQYISSTLIFKEDLEVKQLEVTEALNKISLEEYSSKDGDRKINANVIYDDIEAEEIVVKGNLTGTIAKIDLKEFAERYLSYSKDQIIKGHYDIVHSTVDNLSAKHINGEVFDDYFDWDNISGEIKEMLNTGQIKIQDIYSNGPLHIDSINGQNVNNWLPNDILTDFDGNIRENFTIDGDIYFKTLDIDKISGISWDWHNKQLYRKNETTINIGAAKKNFLGGVKVTKLIETKKLNDIFIDNILTKQGTQKFKGPVVIKGDVTFRESTNITGNLSDVPVREILDNLDIQDDTYHIRGDIFFHKLPHIFSLEVGGYANNKNISEHLSQIVYLDEDSIFSEDIIFEKPVEIAGNLAIGQTLNGIDLLEMENQIILTTKDAEVQGPIAFLQSVVTKGNLIIEEDLITDTLYGFNLTEWQNNVIQVNRNSGMMEGNYIFGDILIKGTLETDYLNEMDMKSVIPLRSDQNISHLEFEYVNITKSISALGLVNGYDNLSAEFEVTAMIDKDQRINSNILFNNVVLVRKTLVVPLINEKNISKIVTTNTDQNLTSNFNFKTQCRMDSDLHVSGLVSGVNLTVWQNKNVKIYSPEVQEVSENWNIARNLTFIGNVDGSGLISGLDFTRIVDEVDERRDYKYRFENDIIENYKNICIDVSHMYREVKKQIYKFMYFDDLQTISFSNQLQFVHYFQFRDDHYLLVNENNCFSQLLIFQKTHFEHFITVGTGHISQVVVAKGNNSIYIVTTDIHLDKKCEMGSTNVWYFDGQTLEFYHNIEEQYLLQESLVPFTFYGLNKQGVIEFKVNYNVPRRYRKWKVFKDNVAFMPRGLKTGLGLRTGHELIFLDTSDPLLDDFNPDVESVIIGNTSAVGNHFIPGRNGGDIVVTKVGAKNSRKTLLAVATHEKTSVKGRLDFVKIYNDVFNGEMFHKVPAYKPSSLLSIEFEQGETLLAFLENEKTLQIFEYRGIEGFKHRVAAKLEGSKLFLMTLPIEPYLNPRKTIGIVHKNTIKIMQSIMSGNRIRDDLNCEL